MIRSLTAILIVLGASASAETLRVRSGEHDGYTRLVVQVPPGTGWRLDQHQGGARLSIALNDVTFETRSVFDRLSGDRLAALSQPAPGAPLDLTFGCECTATAFLHRQTMVVVDIAPGRFTGSGIAAMDLPVTPTVPVAVDLPADALALPLLELDRQGFEDRLLSRILQSADRAVVDLELAGVGRRPTARYGPVRVPPDGASNLRLSSVLDDIRGLDQLALPQLDTQPTCITDSELAFETWSGPAPFSTQVAELRAGLFQEFDRIDQRRALRLARLYAYHGFGAEALQVLAMLPKRPAEADRLAAIAFVMDGLPNPAPNPFEGQQHCDSAAAFWAVLTEGALYSDARLNAIEQAFARLPRHLRRQLGPSLSDLLVAANRPEASRRVLRATERALDTPPADVTLAKAGVAAAAGGPATAETLLNEVTSDPAAMIEAPLALARLVEKRWADRGAISPRDLDLAAGYAREFRRSELGPMMAQTHVLALALSQDFGGALDRIERAESPKDWRRTHDQVLHLLTERSSDITFLRHVLGLQDEGRDAIAIDAAIKIADRLADLGFAGHVHALANRPQDRTHRRDRARLRARAALLGQRPNQALLEITGDASPSAQGLRAQAMMRLSDFEATAQLLQAIGQTEAADRHFWLAGATEDAAGRTGDFGDLIRIAASLTGPVARQTDKPLADAVALLQDSATARDRIVDMLNIVGEP